RSSNRRCTRSDHPRRFWPPRMVAKQLVGQTLASRPSAGREQALVDLVAALVALARKVRQVVGGDVAGDVIAVEARSLEFLQPWIGRAHRALERFEVLVDEEVGADLDGDLGFGAAGGDELLRRR